VTCYSTERREVIRRGHPTSYCARDVRAHIAALHANGMTYRAIAAAAGCSKSTITNVMSGKQTRVWRRTGEAILGLTISDKTPTVLPTEKVPAWRTQRIISELKRCGVTNDEIAAIMCRTHKRGLVNIIGPQRVAAQTEARFILAYKYLMRVGRVNGAVLEDIA